ncbi:hypothetical protein E2320_002272, partial [Naja naja]
MFDGTSKSYIDRHGDEFHDDAQLSQFLGDNLEEEASKWFTQLNDEEAEAELKSIRQKGRLTKELVFEFRRLATTLRH